MYKNFYIEKASLAFACRLLLSSCAVVSVLTPAQASAAALLQQDGQLVRGTVKIPGARGAAAEPMMGVVVMEKGTSNGTATDMDGNFQLRVRDNNAVLVFTLIGYSPSEIPVAGQATINLTLQENTNVLQEVVVTGYQTIDRKMFTGSAVLLKGDDAKRDGITDVSRMLEGRVAGVSVQNVSGTFGAAPKIRVRGATSITGDNKPLWVVDGIILEDVVNVSNEQLSTGDPSTLIGSSVAGLNPDDIESFQILKDASATALYGARAMNGVVVITTKRGKIGKPVVSYTGNYSTYLKPSYSNFDIMNSADQMALYLEMAGKGWLNYANVSRNQNGGVYTKMADLITNSYDPATGSFGLLNTPEARGEFLKRYARTNTDWFDVLFKNSFMQEHSLSISSGTEKSQLYFSTSYLQDDGWTIADQVKRFTGNARANFNVSEKLSVGLISQGSIRDQQAPGTVTRISNPVSGEYNRDFDINPFSYVINTSRTLTPYDENGNLEYFRRNYSPFNILHELDNNTLDISVLDLKLQGDVNYKILPNLTYNFSGAIRYAKTNREHKVRENANMAMAYRAGTIYGDGVDATIQDRNRFLYRNPDDPEAQPVSVLPYGGFYMANDDNLASYYLRNTLDWDNTFNDVHMVRFFASQELRYADRQNKSFTGYGYQYDKGGVPFIDPNAIKQGVEGNFNYYNMNYRYDRFLAYMANAAYSFNQKYNLNATVRYDGSNLLGISRNARWLPTWNVSGSWNIDTEPFMQRLDMVNRLTLRATYGLTASMGNATNSSLVLQSGSTRRPYLTEVESMIYIQNLENSELTWEKQYETNVGVDLGMFNERIQLTVDGYLRNGFDLIGRIRTSGIGGEEFKVANYADMRSYGVEVTLGGGVIDNQDLKLRTQFTLGFNQGKITNLKSNPDIWSLVIPEGGPREGYPHRGLFSIRYQGLDPEDGYPIFRNENGENSGNVYLQSDQINYLKYEGPVDPIVTGGWFNSIRYKDFTLSALVTFSGGNKIRLTPAFRTSYTDMDAMPNYFLDRWVMPGDENRTDVPSILALVEGSTLIDGYPYNNYNYSSARVVNGEFVRLKQLSLGYNLPAKYSNAVGMSNLSLSLVSNNLWLIYADKGLNGQDPEFFNSGGVAMPIPRQFTLSLKAGF
ncbi:SusC/RagA family TonB-linked outer membrane protein [Pontibacter qinzhouensis]|nr:SusC/RagA family TonB-linked outer membrane protein [Pontibacter qinzhouensis]